MSKRLANELALLYRAEAAHKVPAAPIVRQLIIDSERPLPDVLPPCPRWTGYKWPESGSVDLISYWRAKDRGDKQWLGEYL